MTKSTLFDQFKAYICIALSVCIASGCALQYPQQTKMITEAQSLDAPSAPPVVTRNKFAFLAGTKLQVAEQLAPALKKNIVYHPAMPVRVTEIAAFLEDELSLAVDFTGMQLSQANMIGGLPGASIMGSMAGAMSSNMLPAPLGGLGNVLAAINNPYANYAGNSPQSKTPLQMTYSFNYTGTAAGLLDDLAVKLGGFWKFSDGKVVFFRSESKTFYIAALASKTECRSYITTNSGGSSSGASSGAGSAGGSSSAGGGGVGSGSTSSTGVAASSGGDCTSAYGVDTWKDLDKNIKAVAGNGADVSINSSAGSVTVTGSPASVRHVEDWVKKLNDTLSAQVQIDVKVYTVALYDEDNYNWDPNIIFKSLNGKWGGTFAGIASPAVSSGITAATGTGTANSGTISGSTAAVNALSTIGKVSEKVSQSVITLNGQPAPVQAARQIGYLASSSTNLAANVGSTTALTPGTLTVGFTAMFLPRIVNGKVLLAMTMTNSTLNSLSTISSGSSSIQTPNTTTNTFQNSVSLTPGDALVLTNLTRDSMDYSSNGVGSSAFYLFGGGFNRTKTKEISAVVITAKIM